MPCKISIVTSTKNCAESLGITARSIRDQIETSISPQWIVADGASDDGTVEVIKENLDVITNWFSRPDCGIYDAWNHACRLIEGEWVIFLGAGDTLASPTTLAEASRRLQEFSLDDTIAYGNVIQIIDGRRCRRGGPVDFASWDLYRRALPYHQGVFQRSHLLRSNAPFDASYRVAADSKFLLQVLSTGHANWMDMDIGVMEPGGTSANPKHALLIMREFFRMESELGYKLPWQNKLIYRLLSYSRVGIYAAAGAGVVEAIARRKRRWISRRAAACEPLSGERFERGGHDFD